MLDDKDEFSLKEGGAYWLEIFRCMVGDLSLDLLALELKDNHKFWDFWIKDYSTTRKQ